MRIYKKITDLIGNTPLLKLESIEKDTGATVFGKLEYFNPAGSVKDRIAKAMIDDAEAKGILKPDSVIVEPTSGNTGIGLAAVAAARGYQIIITMPETMSVERRNLLKAYGAKVVLKTRTALFRASSQTTPTPRRIMTQPAPRFGMTPTERLIFLSRASVREEPFRAWANILRIRTQIFRSSPLSRPALLSCREKSPDRIRFRESARDLFPKRSTPKYMMKSLR